MNRKLTFIIVDAPVLPKTQTISDLCEHLKAKVLEPLFAREKISWKRGAMDFFTLDNQSSPLEPTGMIRFKVPPIFAGRTQELESAIQRELKALKIKSGSVAYDRNPRTKEIISISIPITENPAALMAPPEVNMSQTRGYVVLRDLLGYEKLNGGFEFTAKDLLERVAEVTEDRIDMCTASPVKGSAGVRRTPSPTSVKAVRRCLEELKQLAHWAISRKYRTISAA